MAKYTNSPFGTIKGAQMGMVGARWKGTNYVRQHVIPANPKTAAQTAQRNKLANITNFGKRIVDTVINVTTIPLPKKMSAFNEFVGRNVKLQSLGTMDYTELVISTGALYNPGGATWVGDVSDHDIEVSFGTELQGQAEGTDNALLVCYNETKDKFYVGGSDTRADGSTVVDATGLELGDTVHSWLIFKKADGSMISNSEYHIVNVQA